MKLNGALKPRQGASSRGSSPGVVLRKYRDKRYYKLNGNVVKGLPLSKCGVKNYKNNNNNNNNNNDEHQHNQQMKCSENPSSLYSSSSVTNYNKNNNNYNNNNNNNKNSAQYRITTAVNIDYKSHGSRKSPTAAAATAINHNEKEEEEEENVVEFRQIPVHNITTRQVNMENTMDNNKETNNKMKKGRELAEVIRIGLSTVTKLNTSKYHVTSNNSNSNNNNYLFRKGVNKFLLISKIYENLILCALTFLTVIISWLFTQLKLLLLCCMCSRTETPLTGYLVGGRGDCMSVVGCGGIVGSGRDVRHNLLKIMRASQPFKKLFDRICFKNVNKSRLPPSLALCMIIYAAAAILLPQPVVADDGDNFYPINGLETTTPEFDYASRGQKKFGDKCENTLECGFPGSICDPKKKSCQCTEDLPVTNHIDKCGKEAAVNESCFFNEQCEVKYFQTECRDQRCVCRFDMSPIWLKDGTVECKGRGEKKQERYIDPAMIGVLIGMALMFIIICVVLRLFSQARWRENRTIFNTPNPRLMNVSLLRESKLLHGQERRGSRMSVRAPSRQPSMASLRPHSPNPSLGKTGSRSNSHGSSVSATSLRSTRSNSVSPAGIVVNNSHHERKGSTYQPHHHHHHHHPPTHQHQQPPSQSPQQQEDEHEHEQKQPLTQTNITPNPVAESITVEIIEPEK